MTELGKSHFAPDGVAKRYPIKSPLTKYFRFKRRNRRQRSFAPASRRWRPNCAACGSRRSWPRRASRYTHCHSIQYHAAMQIDQIAIPILGAAAAWASQERRESVRKWACIFGLIGQPFWFYASWKAQQWGIFAVSILYAFAWMRGLWVYWLQPKEVPAG